MRRAVVANAKRPRLDNNNNNNDADSNNNDNDIDDAAMGAAPMEETMTCVVVVEEGPKIAFACYDEQDNSIVLETCHAHGHDTETVVEAFFAVARPNLVLVNNKIVGNPPLLHLLTRPPPVHIMNHGDDSAKSCDTGRSLAYRLLKTGAFDLRNCRALILTKLRVLSLLKKPCRSSSRSQRQQPQMMHHHRQHQQQSTSSFERYAPSSYHSIASLVDFDSLLQVRALGALLSFLQDTIFRLEQGATVTVNDVKYAHSAQVMRMDSATLQSLHIFATEHHPLMAKGQGHVKEGFSLFSLLDRTKSKVGRQCLREWMLKPLLDATEIAKRQDGVEMFMQTDFDTNVEELLSHLENIGAVHQILMRVQKCLTKPMDFIILAKTLDAALGVCHILAEDFESRLKKLLATESSSSSSSVSTLHDTTSSSSANTDDVQNTAARFLAFVSRILDQCAVPVLRDLHNRIVSIVDQDLTLESKANVIIREGFHEELDMLREQYEHLDETLVSAADQISEKHAQLRNLNVIFIPQVGFLVELEKHQIQQPQQDDDDDNDSSAKKEYSCLPDDFECVFSRETKVCFKNDEVRVLDCEIGDLHGSITDTVGMIVTELEEDILDCETELRSTFTALAELDCILSFASCAVDNNYTRPTLLPIGETCIQIKNGRHPLQELIVDGEFIQNDTDMNGTRSRVNIITGPNFSGKSCYTRQVGMLVYMAHIGCYLPCDAATISMTDQIFTRISAAETCSVPQSSFQLDLTQMASILRRSTPSSLVLIDEFGKGTSPSSGIAVLTAAIRKLSRMKCKVICTTHFLEVFSLGLLKDGIDGIRAHRMTVHIPQATDGEKEDQQDDSSGAAPLFKLEQGVAESSAGLVCAERAGVNKKVLDRAKEILVATKEGRTVLPLKESMRLPELKPDVKDVLRMFLGVDSWANATDEELQLLEQKVARIAIP